MIITFGALAVFFLSIVVILMLSWIRDRTFSDYAVGGRSFDARFQAMSFLNTYFPGAVITAFGGMAASVGALSFYFVTYTMLTVVLMYLMAKPVWVWGKAFDLRTQSDLLALRFGSRHIRPISAVLGIVTGLPWLIMGMLSLGFLFQHLSLQSLSFENAVIVGVVVIAFRQIWTVWMGMRGVVISDMAQGLVAYVGGTIILVGMIVWMVAAKDITFASLDPKMLSIPGLGSAEGPLFVFSLLLTGTIGGWCWPAIFVRLYTADGVRSLKKSAALAVPLALVFATALLVFGMLGSQIPGVAEKPDEVIFIVSLEAGGLWLLALAGVVVMAASMGNIDGHIQATGAQLANDLVGTYWTLDHRQLIVVAKGGMVVLTLFSAWLATLELPALFAIAILAYQGVIQLAVPQFLGLFWKRGNAAGAIAGMSVGFALVLVLEYFYPMSLPWAYGLTSGLIALAANLAIYVAAAYLIPQTDEERARVDGLFSRIVDKAPEAEEACRSPDAPASEVPA
ncbi:sodium:solute symporter family protein [Hyphomicrobium sp.]|uniref:sodium:solute symporter family protein n=1 Tax=Hyphomicrobium sp. TaxID=82 RepID=UPI002C39B7FC|nr:sodium:solute symporter family protein [Hyphomicrobium sp.]HRN89522.1 sodium:solute symporter family protein [Hyphomicrobium sp.]HRQ28025.1 sodium:solute symporter family protein [Hyphomicrobium sp.]